MRFQRVARAAREAAATFKEASRGAIGSLFRSAAAKRRQPASASSRETTMTRLASIVVLAGLIVIGLPRAGAAETPSPPDGAAAGGRYSFHRIGESFIRLDAQTGQVA